MPGLATGGAALMLHIVVLLCAIEAPQVCAEHSHSFVPRQPVACIFAAAPELERITPDGWTVAQWRCTPLPRLGAR